MILEAISPVPYLGNDVEGKNSDKLSLNEDENEDEDEGVDCTPTVGRLLNGQKNPNLLFENWAVDSPSDEDEPRQSEAEPKRTKCTTKVKRQLLLSRT